MMIARLLRPYLGNWWLITLIVFCPLGAVQRASAADLEMKTLSLEEAKQLALGLNKDIQKAREYRKMVMGKYVEERSWALPQASLSSSFSKADDKSQAAMGGGTFPIPTDRSLFTLEAGASWTIFTWGQLGAAIRAAKEGIADADAQLKIYQQAVIQEVTTAFYDVLLVREFHGLARQNLEQKERHLNEAKHRFEAGVATDFDILAAEVAVENARPDVIKTENQIRLARERLRFLVGLEGKELDVSGSLDGGTLNIPPPDYATALNKALQNRPEISEIGHRIKIAEEVVKVSAAGNKPRVALQGGIGYRNLEMGGSSADGVAWSAGIYANFPVFDAWRSKGQVMQARSQVDSFEIDRNKLVDGITLQVRDALNNYHESEEIMKALTGTVGQAERLLVMVEKGFELGVKTRLDVEDVQLNVMNAKSNLARAKRDNLVAQSSLEWVMGTLPLPSTAP